jgi:large subunit ribosomal protein L15
MKLHDLKPNEGKVRPRKRVGRGTGSGDGKTAGRGTKGQGARAGGGTGLYHQGGNLPFFRRLPFKRGFNVPFQITYNEINLDQLANVKGSEVNPETLGAAKLLRKPHNPIVILGRGEVKSALKVSVHRITAGAKTKIEKAGGSVDLIALTEAREVAKALAKAEKLKTEANAKPRAEAKPKAEEKPKAEAKPKAAKAKSAKKKASK